MFVSFNEAFVIQWQKSSRQLVFYQKLARGTLIELQNLKALKFESSRQLKKLNSKIPIREPF